MAKKVCFMAIDFNFYFFSIHFFFGTYNIVLTISALTQWTKKFFYFFKFYGCFLLMNMTYVHQCRYMCIFFYFNYGKTWKIPCCVGKNIYFLCIYKNCQYNNYNRVLLKCHSLKCNIDVTIQFAFYIWNNYAYWTFKLFNQFTWKHFLITR